MRDAGVTQNRHCLNVRPDLNQVEQSEVDIEQIEVGVEQPEDDIDQIENEAQYLPEPVGQSGDIDIIGSEPEEPLMEPSTDLELSWLSQLSASRQPTCASELTSRLADMLKMGPNKR